MNGVLAQIWERLGASLHPGPAPAEAAVLVAVVAALAAVLLGPAWRILRVVVTLVHELGHALVGLAAGRRLAGFTVNPDMSGATTTSGATSGPGLVLTTLAGYPMPAVVGVLIGQAALGGYARAVLTGIAVVLLLVLPRARSVHTVAALLGTLAADIALWWYADSTPASATVLGLGVFLVAGAWRQLVNVARHGDRTQDPGVLAARTHVPAAVWNLAFALVLAGASWWFGRSLLPFLPLP
ncbi:M50 family metallopeptidase [Propionibacterium australiense]|uniref:M50 family metallopeptidase n=1 Tax=Propionibacterium australiense TaxID=119981 RepID=UPI0018D5484E|nr:M50 family metallopeptidase [Propionibacterium australiense]